MLDRRGFMTALGGMVTASVLPVPGLLLAAAEPASIRRTGRYEGMEAGAAWRHDALKRIEALRKADFQIEVRDGRGRPVPNAEIHISQHRHHFGFGAAVQPAYLFESGKTAHQAFYRETTSRYFHRVTIANGLKWKHYQNRRALVDQCLEWCMREQLPVRGHCLVWPRFRRIPKHLESLRTNRAKLRETIEQHIRELVSLYDEPLIEWDVLNEPFTEHEFMDLLGPEVVHDWFRIAQETNPRLTRYINDFGVLTRPSERHQQFYFDYIQNLLNTGVAVQGIGFQGHIPEAFDPTPPEQLLQTMDRFATLGLALQVTEFDFETTDLELQARYTSDFLIAVFSHPAMTGLVTWTPYEYLKGRGSKPDAAFFDYKRREKPNGQVWNNLVNRDWRTDTNTITAENGRAVFRGFKGSYNIGVSVGSGRVKRQASLINDGDQVAIVLQDRNR